jgi:hypothetical protein
LTPEGMGSMADGGSTDLCSEPRRPRWPVGFVGMLGLLLAVESILARGELGLDTVGAADWGLNRAEAVREARDAEILCFGDSLIKCGVAPAVLEARLDRAAYNLASLGATPPASYFLLKRTLDAGARPRAILYDAKASTLNAANYWFTVRDWANLVGPWDAWRLARDDRNPAFFGLHLVHYLIPSVRVRLDLRAKVVAQIAGAAPGPEITWGAIVERQHGVNLGGIYRPPTHPKAGPDPFPDGVLPLLEDVVCYPTGWSPYPTNLVYVDKFLALAESREIPVFFVVPPIHPGVQAGREKRGLDAIYIELVKKIHGRYKNVTVIDGRHAGFGHEVFADSHHLDLEGAAALTDSLARVIASRLGSPVGGDRWIPLPPFVRPASWPPIENMDESRVALARQAARR